MDSERRDPLAAALSRSGGVLARNAARAKPLVHRLRRAPAQHRQRAGNGLAVYPAALLSLSFIMLR
ncbi:MAG TPA: hypothetical protein VGF39_14945 [Stellaceae bacterium]